MRPPSAPPAFFGVVFLLLFVSLFVGRAADDNVLFSWAWIFDGTEAASLYLALVAALILSSALAKREIPEPYLPLVLVTTSFAACAPFWRESELIVDASRYFTQAKHLELYGVGYFFKEWGGSIHAWTDLPLVPFFYGLIFKLFGESRTAIQAFTTTLFSLTTLLTYLIGKTLWDRETGFSAGLLLLGIPYLLTQIPLMLVDVPTMFFLTLSLYTFLDALNRGGGVRTLWCAAILVMTVGTKYSAWPMLSVVGVGLIAHLFPGVKTEKHRPVQRGTLLLLVAAAVAAALLQLKSDVVLEQLRLLSGYQRAGLERWRESFLSTFLFQAHPLITLAALVSVFFAIRKRDVKFAIISWPLLLVVAFNIGRIRYLVPLFPFLTLMAGYGLRSIQRAELRRYLVFGAVASSLAVALFAYLPFAGRMSADNLKQAGAYLDTLEAAAIEVVTLPPRNQVINPAVAVPLLDLFTGKSLRYAYQPERFPAWEEVEKSSLRFSWEFRNPAYYALPPAPNAPIIVLSDADDDSLPASLAKRLRGYRQTASFHGNERIFRYTVGARVYTRTEGPQR